MITKFYKTLFILLFFYNSVTAQFFNYTSTSASVENLSYFDLGTAGTRITTNYKGQPINTNGDNSNVQNIGFNFNFAGTIFTQFTLNTNGFIKLGNDTADIAESEDILFSNHSKSVNVIYPLNRKLVPTANAEFRVFISGAVGSRTCTIQFEGMGDNGCSNCENPPFNASTDQQFENVEFQIVLFETSNSIQFIYGNFTTTLNPAGYIPFNCGLKSSSSTNSVNATKSSQSQHLNTTFIDGAYTGNRFNNRSNLPPIPGFTITWTPIIIRNNNVELKKIYSIGKVPRNYDHEVKVELRNIGATALTNYPVTINVAGANTRTLSTTIPNLASGEKTSVSFPFTSYPNVGNQQLIVNLPNDDDNNDNVDTFNQVVTNNTIGYSASNVSTGVLGNTTNSIDMAVKFRNNSVGNRVMSITSYLDTAGRPFRMYLYSTVSGDTPRAKLTNPTTNITSVIGANTVNYTNGIAVTGDFFVVVTQTEVNRSLRLGFQREDPIRDKTFYFRIPQGSTVNPVARWEDFAPSNPFRLMVDVTMQNAFLPVNLMNFTAGKDDKFNALSWQTQGEVNNKGFEIERSLNGKDFEKIGFVNAKGNPYMLANYLFLDKNPANGNNYYRLKQIDKDGTSTYSDVVLVRNIDYKKIEIISLYPNPSLNESTLLLSASKNDKVVINTVNSLGKIVSTQTVNTIVGENKIQLNTSSLPKGNYIVTVAEVNSENFATTNLIKQ